MDKITSGLYRVALRVLLVVTALSFVVFVPMSVHAQSALMPTQILVGASDQATNGGKITVQAVLADAQGHPISRAMIYFTTRTTFLKSTSDVVLAQAATNAAGQAVAQVADNFSGSITLRAEFRGDAQYAASNATVAAGPAGAGQVYVEHIGVDLPGFNVPPVLGSTRASVASPLSGIGRFVDSLWPAMNAWPLAAVLFIVWALYLFAISFVFRVAAAARNGRDSTSTGTGGSL